MRGREFGKQFHPLLGASLNCRLCFFPRDSRGPASFSLSFAGSFLFSVVYRFTCFFACEMVSCSLVFTFSFSFMLISPRLAVSR
jgi:hypothetical protein